MLRLKSKFCQLAAVLLIAAVWAPLAEAASVRGVNAKKGQIAVEGLKAGKGATVCVYSGKKKIDCGTVVSVKGGTTYVSITNKKNLKRMKKGMTVMPEGGGSGSSAVAGKGSSSDTKIYLQYTPGIATPAVFNKIGYAAPESSGVPDSLWESDGVTSQTLLGFGLQVGPFTGLSIMPGFRYRIFSPNQIDADYFARRENPYVTTVTSGTAIGLFADLAFLKIPFGGMIDLYGAGGLDIDMSTVTVKSEKKDDTGGEEGTVANATSNLTVVSLRAGGGLNLVPAKPFGASLGLNLLVPLVELGKKFTGSLEENEGRGVPEPGADLKEKLGHKKNGFGIDIHASILLVF